MPLPQIILNIGNDMYGLPNEGSLTYQYNPFQNLQIPDPGINEDPLTDLTISSAKGGIDITKPITIETEVSYDDSVNLILTDCTNPLKIVNSRFYQTSTTTYKVSDRKGNLDTNIYTEEHFKTETALIKSVKTITEVEFLGIQDGGINKVGSYTFYFTLSDADGNESDFIAESGKIVCHIGTENSPKSIRGGLLDENSYKLIKLRLKNLDLAYDYINIYYTRSTGSDEESIIKTYKITDKFKITNDIVNISVTGYENNEEILITDINTSYSNFDSGKTVASCQNILFVGGTVNNYEIFKTLEKYSLFIVPKVAYDPYGIGNLDSKYHERFIKNGQEYSNTKNIYYKLGYWDEEIYRTGIVYIMNDYTLSPVFNTRGKTFISTDTVYTDLNIRDEINYTEDYLLEDSLDKSQPENIKGVFKIDSSSKEMFNGYSTIRPLGIKFEFLGDVVDGNEFLPGLKDLTKGFFFVRQKRIPTILAQGVGIATSEKAKIPVVKVTNTAKNFISRYVSESFLDTKSGYQSLPVLGSSLFKVWDVITNALLCPEANLRSSIYNTLFNSSEYLLKKFKYNPTQDIFTSYDGKENYSLGDLVPQEDTTEPITTELTLIEPGVEGLRNSKYTFSSKAGDALIPHKYVDPILGNYEDLSIGEDHENEINISTSKVRGEFNTFVGTNTDKIEFGQYYNIFSKGYNFEERWKEYFRIRYNDSSAYYPIGDRTDWSKLKYSTPNTYNTDILFRGDCYINTFTHRVNWNFTDPETPTNKRIINPLTWATNFKVKKKASTIIGEDGTPGDSGLTFYKLLPLFTYKHVFIPDWVGQVEDDESGASAGGIVVWGLLEPESKRFKKYATINGEFGTDKINRPDVNAVPLGHWLTFKICSNVNLAMRDLDFSNPKEEAVFQQKRGFYPLQSIDPSNPLPESTVINSGVSKTTSDKHYFEFPDVPFIKTNFTTRINYSNPLQSSVFTNGNRIFKSVNFMDYTREYGALIKLIEWYETLVAVMEHGIVLIPVNERAMMTNTAGENVYINTDTVLPKNPRVLSNTFGSLWEHSIIKTDRFIYGIDTVAKKIWRTNGKSVETISDIKVQKFLNDKIKLRESDNDQTIGINLVKTHYNAFKHDILFVFKYDGIKWHLCWNELTGKWTTQYTWIPEFSENINNIFYTFANQENHTYAENKLYKHGHAGTEDETGNIESAFWYGEQHPFEYEFIVGEIPGIQKIFNNLKIISNLVEPESFYYEVVGEGFDWFTYKDLIWKLNNTLLDTVNGVSMAGISTTFTEANVKLRYERYLLSTPTLKKLPYIFVQSFDVNDSSSFYRNRGPVIPPVNMSTLRDLTLRKYDKTNELLINSYQKGANMKLFRRLKGNMQYLEDVWDIQIQPIIFPYAYIKDGVITYTENQEMKIRDKYIKIRVKYSGTEYAIINAIRTIFTISYA